MVNCPKCQSDHYKLNGKNSSGNQRFKCKECGYEFVERSANKKFEYTSNGVESEFVLETDRRIQTVEELIELLQIDTKKWEITKFSVAKNEGYRKDRKVRWRVENGVVIEGDVQDSGKLLIEPLWSVKVWLKRKTQEIRTNAIFEDLLEDIKNYTYTYPTYPEITYFNPPSGLMYEVAIPDIHLGKMTWDEESGESSDLKTQTQRVVDAVFDLLKYASKFPIDRILLPIGNDFFNVDTILNTTTKGTPQQEDTRWQKTFRAGRELCVKLIDVCQEIAPVDVLIIPGNHDEMRTFYLGDALVAWYNTNPNVNIDNRAIKRKYYQYGKVLIGFTHGNNEKIKDLSQIMAYEEPSKWADTYYREWHLGDKHHKTDYQQFTDETPGIVIRSLRSLSPVDAWHHAKGFVGSLSGAEAFLWSDEQGLIAQFLTTVKPYASSPKTNTSKEKEKR